MTSVRRDSAGDAPRGTRGKRAARVAVSAAAVVLLAGGGVTAWSLTPEQASAAGEQADPAAKKADQGDDFDGDGYADLVIGAPGGTVSGKAKAGYVAVTYGSAEGLDPANRKVVNRSTSGVPGSATAEQQFGASFSKGDLDGDGFDDLVVGSGDLAADGVILWGSEEGLTGGTAVPSYGATPQIGDFDGDGKADLAVLGDPGQSGDDPVAQPAALWKGPVSRDGVPARRLDFLHPSEWGGYDDEYPGEKCVENDSCIDGPESMSGPSHTRAVGDVNGDGRQDIGIRLYEGDGVYGHSVLLGGESGFTVARGPSGGGGDVSLGDVDGDGFDDLVVSDTYMSEGVTVVFGSEEGLSEDRRQTFDQDIEGFPGEQQDGDVFGSCLAVADVTGDGRAEVAVGIRGKNAAGLADAGAVALFRGTESGVTGTGSALVHQDSDGVPGVAEEGDAFGGACALIDVDGDGHRDLNVSAIEENESAGALWSLRGTAEGVTTAGTTAFGPGDVDAPVAEALFGSRLG